GSLLRRGEDDDFGGAGGEDRAAVGADRYFIDGPTRRSDGHAAADLREDAPARGGQVKLAELAAGRIVGIDEIAVRREDESAIGTGRQRSQLVERRVVDGAGRRRREELLHEDNPRSIAAHGG